jgi:hypothetical protein
MTPKKGDEVSYRALAGGIYPAVVSRVGPDGLLEIDVQLPGVKDAFGRTRVKWYDEKVAERGVCFPKETADEKRKRMGPS